MTDDLARRDLLKLAGAAALGGALAACTSSAGSPDHPSTPARSSSAPTGSSPASSSSASPSPVHSSAPSFAALARQLSGDLVRPGHSGYDPAALLYNPRFSTAHQPQAIARCRTAKDVAACVRFAAGGGAPLRMRNGGHSYGGWSSGAGLVADLAALRSVSVDTHARTATVGAGALLADVYTALSARGVAIGAGSCPTVGITGLTLGGGVGVLSRAYGLTCDQLRSAEVVTADGRIRTVDAHTDADLFWALRGGGGSFGALTSLTFAVRPAPTIETFFLQWPFSAAGDVLTAWQGWIRDVPRELWSTCKLLTDPGHGSKVTVSGTWIGSSSLTTQLQRLLKSTPAPAQRYTNRAGYGAIMLAEAGCSGLTADRCITDALAPAKRQPFAASSSILQKALPAAGVSAIVAAVAAGAQTKKLVEGGASFDSLGGAVADVAAADTAVPWRSALATVQYTATWAYADAHADPTPFDAFVRAERRALTPWVGTAAYVNYADPSIADFAPAYWGDNLPRLEQVKRRYDPHDVFSFAQSVPR